MEKLEEITNRVHIDVEAYFITWGYRAGYIVDSLLSSCLGNSLNSYLSSSSGVSNQFYTSIEKRKYKGEGWDLYSRGRRPSYVKLRPICRSREFASRQGIIIRKTIKNGVDKREGRGTSDFKKYSN